jgi:hypothetical protein
MDSSKSRATLKRVELMLSPGIRYLVILGNFRELMTMIDSSMLPGFRVGLGE